MTQVVDHSALKVNQTGIVATVLLAFAGSIVSGVFFWLIPALAVVLLLGTFVPRLALFKQLYFQLLMPAGIVRRRPIEDSPAPHNFAQGMGGAVLVLASLVFLISPAVGLALSLLVGLLAFVNLAFGYCVGCQIYYFLSRRGLLATRA